MFARVVQERLLGNVPSALFVLSALPVLMLATSFFWRRSLDVFHYSGAANASKTDPKMDRFSIDFLIDFEIDFWRFLGGQDGHKTPQDGHKTPQDAAKTAQDGPKMAPRRVQDDSKTIPRRPRRPR